jgi:hypothetical protein
MPENNAWLGHRDQHKKKKELADFYLKANS